MTSLYRPQFAADEFRSRSFHYEIRIAGKTILYCYIRKNACSAFKRLIGRRMPAKYWVKAALRGNAADRYEIEGGLNRFAVPMDRAVDPAAYDHIVFVYRDPAERFISAYMNKFVEVSGAADIKPHYEALTGKDFATATFADYIAYTRADFTRLDPHLWPQKAHLWDLPYTPIRIDRLQAGMAALIGEADAKTFFSRKVNASEKPATPSTDDLTDVPAARLREMRQQGGPVTRHNFLTETLRAHVAEKYAADIAMIADIEGGQSA